MSRIHEALKRARTSSGDADRAGATVLRLDAVPTSAALAAADYPPEREAEEPAPPENAPPRNGVMHKIAAVASRLKVPPAVEGKVVIDPSTADASVEQYRKLAAALHQAQLAHGIKTVMVSSAVPREGKTLTATNLALTLSDSYAKRVLLIDGDLRRPGVHEVLGVPNTVGLGDVLRSGMTPAPLIDINAMLTVLPAGRPDHDPIAGLTSERLTTLLREAAGQFDWIILDSPPAGVLSDGPLLRDVVDGVILVIGAGATDYRLVERTIADIGRERIIGAVLNRVADEHIATSGYYQYYASGDTSDAQPQ
jgi:capsular exopolysaccharide synthesis family protein